MPAQYSVDALTAEHDFVRRLAHSLLRDAHDAEDVAQQAWLRARSASPTDRRGLLATVVHNLARNLRRDSARRVSHERRAARAEALPSTAEVLEFEARRREVVDAVLALPEPYRGTVVATYFECRSPRQLAQTLGVPAATVRSRLHRALQLLREQLDRRHAGDRRAWATALAPIGYGAGPLMLGGVSVKKLLFAGVAAIVALLTGYVLWPDRTPAGEGPARSAATVSAGLPPAAEPIDAVPRTVVAVPAGEPRRAVTGTLVHADGSPARDLAYWTGTDRDDATRRSVATASTEAAGRTDADGAFAWPAEAAVLWVRVDDAHDVAIPLGDVELGAEFTLPERGAIEVQFSGVPDRTVIRCEYVPGWVAGSQLEHAWTWVDAVNDRGRNLYVHRRRAEIVGAGSTTLILPALVGFPYHLRPSATELELDVTGGYATAPSRVVYTAVAAAPVWTLRLLEPDGEPSRRAAFAMSSYDYGTHAFAHCERFESGELALDLGRIRRGDEATVRVIADDGQWFERKLARRPEPGGSTVELVLGQGNPALRLALPAGDWRYFWMRTANATLLNAPLRDDMGYQDVDAVHVITPAGELALPFRWKDWEHVYAIATDGRIAIAERHAGDNALRWLPAERELPAVSPLELADTYRELDGFFVRFEVQPPGLPAGEWLLADRATFSRKVRYEPVVWRKLATRGVPYRFLLVDEDGVSREIRPRR